MPEFILSFIVNIYQRWFMAFFLFSAIARDPKTSLQLMTFWHGKLFALLALSEANHRYIPPTKSHHSLLLVSTNFEQTIELPIIWDGLTLTWRHWYAHTCQRKRWSFRCILHIWISIRLVGLWVELRNPVTVLPFMRQFSSVISKTELS